jgi:4-hydroxybenzoate polyprenyltransferase
MTIPKNWQPYAQLVRLPNVFTALADIGLGALVVSAAGGAEGLWLRYVWLMACSACLYSAGMVWNDFFDIEQDRRERPFRPLPSAKIWRTRAAQIGIGLIAAGLLFAFLASGNGTLPLRLAVMLVAAILLYDGWLKRTWAGPIGMGTCRFLNVLLGLSPPDPTLLPWANRLYLATIVGIYIVGVTWFARTEARASSRPALTCAATVMLASLLMGLAVPVLGNAADTSPLFPYLLVGLGFLVGIPVIRAIDRPIPAQVQPAVKRAIVGLVVLDATLAAGLAGTLGLILLVLLLPTLYLGRWLYST